MEQGKRKKMVKRKAKQNHERRDSDLGDLVRSLLLSGYRLDSMRRRPSCTILHTHKFDRLGAELKYSILLPSGSVSQIILKGFLKEAGIRRSFPIGIDIISPTLKNCYSKDEFYEMIGGRVISWVVFDSELANVLNVLGQNLVPQGHMGEASDLLEEYVKECLQFIFNKRVCRYGQKRRFEKLPDGVAIDSKGVILQYDTKACGNGYSIDADDIRRFASYVEDFHSKYEALVGRVYAFLIVTANFHDSQFSLEQRRNELYEKCGVQLSCLQAKELGKIVQLIKDNAKYREAVNWKKVFSNVVVQESHLEKQISSLIKDKILQ
jgi:hypothetical protein